MIVCTGCPKNTRKSHAELHYGLCVSCRDKTINMLANIKKGNFSPPACIGCGENHDGRCEMCNKCLKYFSIIDCDYDFEATKSTRTLKVLKTTKTLKTKKDKKTKNMDDKKLENEDSESKDAVEEISPGENITKKEEKSGKIPKAVRSRVWKIAFGELFVGKCECCKRKIEFDNWECGHIQARKCGGLSIADNLRPLCTPCNRSMGTQNLYDFKDKLCLNENEGEAHDEKVISIGEKVIAQEEKAVGQEEKVVIGEKIIEEKVVVEGKDAEEKLEQVQNIAIGPNILEKIFDMIKAQNEEITKLREIIEKQTTQLDKYVRLDRCTGALPKYSNNDDEEHKVGPQSEKYSHNMKSKINCTVFMQYNQAKKHANNSTSGEHVVILDENFKLNLEDLDKDTDGTMCTTGMSTTTTGMDAKNCWYNYVLGDGFIVLYE